MNELALFAGAGGGILGGKLLGWRTVCAVEIEPFATGVLMQRQNDGILSPFPIWDDVSSFNGKPWNGIVDVVSGGFPCQDLSCAGKGKGLAGEKSGLWKEFARIIHEVRPKYAFVENSPVLRTKGLDRVLADLAEMGYDAEWCVLGGADCGFAHIRKRLWILAHTNGFSKQESGGNHKTIIHKQNTRLGLKRGSHGCGSRVPHSTVAELTTAVYKKTLSHSLLHGYSTEPGMGRLADGVAHRMERLTVLGNGQIPAVAATAWSILSERL